ncbi:AMP-binding protein [Actinosynnema sp. NPDC020468]|uniref:AMP-binding protein n=1 Tax=Actinosynnema sp. NPDC020468 TaxID=3154488 RepID=UPI0033E18551
MAVRAAALPPWSVDPADGTDPPPALGDLFVAPARRWPDRAAIDDGATGYTFAELEEGTLAVAAWLAGQGVGPGDRVVVLAEKRAVVPILAVAVWKRGAVYVPLDAAEPVARLRGLLARLEPAVVIALDDRDDPVATTGRRLGGAELAGILAGPPATHTTSAHPPGQAAYIIFASGPTGEPQGVENKAESLHAYFRAHNEVLRFTSASRVLSLAPFHVDVSFEDTLLPLSLGAFTFQFRNLPAGAVMRAVLGRERITHLIAVTMLLTMITGDGRQLTRAKLPDLELVMTGAQVCDPAVLDTWKRQLPDVRLLHAFGPPEATVFSVSQEIGAARTTPYPIGRPLRGLTATLVADGVEITEPGVPGELQVGGEQVMLRYFDHPAETDRVLVERDGTRYFRTGDVCAYDEEGALVFLRHGDEDVTWIAGRRTHLGEIRRVAQGCAGVDRAIAARIRRDNRDVVALVVVAADRRVLPEVEALLSVLPDYLRPTVIAWSHPTTADDGAVVERLADAARRSPSRYFALSADDAVEPIDKVEPCL